MKPGDRTAKSTKCVACVSRALKCARESSTSMSTLNTTVCAETWRNAPKMKWSTSLVAWGTGFSTSWGIWLTVKSFLLISWSCSVKLRPTLLVAGPMLPSGSGVILMVTHTTGVLSLSFGLQHLARLRCHVCVLCVSRSVSRHELFPIRAPLMALEHCIAPFLNKCDADDDHMITLKEWGKCLELEEVSEKNWSVRYFYYLGWS